MIQPNSTYRIRWRRKAKALLEAQAQGKFLDRRERRSTQHYIRFIAEFSNCSN